MSSHTRPLSKREIEEVKKKDELKRSADVFSDFIQAFEEAEPAKKFTAFVRGGVSLPGKGEVPVESGSQVYELKPKSSSSSSSSHHHHHSDHHKERSPRSSTESHRHQAPPPSSSSSSKPVLVKKPKDKKKSNLEIFKEELRQIQEEREERKKLKDQIGKLETKLGSSVSGSSSHSVFLDDDNRVFDGTYDLSGDSTSTNLYMGNIAPGVTEDQICQAFGRYGPIASVKIMYPRGEEKLDRNGRNTLCGFVAFMCRSDAERALYHLRGKEVYGTEMRLGWGKVVPIPTFPIYVPPKLAELLEPPPYSGLPFNAQPDLDSDWDRLPQEEDPPLNQADTLEILSRSVVRVVQPSERSLLAIIHRVIEFIIREGPMFEAMLMQQEKGNPMYRFLFDNRSNEHVYFRWKLFSILQGETPTQWRTKEFRMFDGGPMWKPPPINPYCAGMPEELVERGDDTSVVREAPERRRRGGGGGSANHKEHPVSSGKAGLSDPDRKRLGDLLNDLTPSRDHVADAMVFCIDHADVAEDIIATIIASIQLESDSPLKKVAKIYLVSDILHNCSGVHVQNAWYYRNGFEQKFPLIFTHLRKSYRSIEGRLKAEQYKQRVMNCFRAWEDWALYPPKYLIKLQNIFLGLEVGETPEESPFDGQPIIEAAPPPVVRVPSPIVEADVDGVPLDEDLDGEPLKEEEPPRDTAGAPVAFAPSRWETVDPDQVKAQAITTSKWDQLDNPAPHGSSDNGDDSAKQQEKKLDDHVREKLREIEMRVLKYQDDVETGRRSRHVGESLSDQVAKYRKQLMGTPSSSSTSSASKERSSSTRDRDREKEKRSTTKRSRSRSPQNAPSRDSRPSAKSRPSSERTERDRKSSTSSSANPASTGQRRRSRSRERERRH